MDFEIPGLWDLARGQRQEVGGHALNARQRAARTAKRRARQAQQAARQLGGLGKGGA
jgi:hypothetical protein